MQSMLVSTCWSVLYLTPSPRRVIRINAAHYISSSASLLTPTDNKLCFQMGFICCVRLQKPPSAPHFLHICAGRRKTDPDSVPNAKETLARGRLRTNEMRQSQLRARNEAAGITSPTIKKVSVSALQGASVRARNILKIVSGSFYISPENPVGLQDPVGPGIQMETIACSRRLCGRWPDVMLARTRPPLRAPPQVVAP